MQTHCETMWLTWSVLGESAMSFILLLWAWPADTHAQIYTWNVITNISSQLVIKGIVHPKNENDVINYLPSCRSKPVRPSFIFWTQIKIFLMQSESSPSSEYHIRKQCMYVADTLFTFRSKRKQSIRVHTFIHCLHMWYSPKWCYRVTQRRQIVE